MDWYVFFGTLNSLLIIVSVYGIYAQLNTVWQRKSTARLRSESTSLLSLNQFTVSYFAYLAFFIYGFSVEPFNHYIVWPRLVAAILVLMILYEIWVGRNTRSSTMSFISCSVSLVVAFFGLLSAGTFVDEGKVVSTMILCTVSFLLAQGYWHQIKLVIDSGHTGAINLKMSQFILVMDFSTIAFALTMPVIESWPLILLATTSAITKLIIIYLFVWVKISPVAAKRRVNP